MGYIVPAAISRSSINRSFADLVATGVINETNRRDIRAYIASNLSTIAQALQDMTFVPPTEWSSKRNAAVYPMESLAMQQVLAKSFADVCQYYMDKAQEDYLPFITHYRSGQDAMDLANSRTKLAHSMGFCTAVLFRLPNKFSKQHTDCLQARFHAELEDSDKQLDHLIQSYIASGIMRNGFTDVPIDGGILSHYLYPLFSRVYLYECLRKAVRMGYCTALLPGHLMMMSTRRPDQQVLENANRIAAHLTTSLKLDITDKDVRIGALENVFCLYSTNGRTMVL